MVIFRRNYVKILGESRVPNAEQEQLQKRKTKIEARSCVRIQKWRVACGRRPRNGTSPPGRTPQYERRERNFRKNKRNTARRLVELSRRVMLDSPHFRDVCRLASSRGFPARAASRKVIWDPIVTPAENGPLDDDTGWFRVRNVSSRENFLAKHGRIFSPGGDSDVFLMRDVLLCRTHFPGNFFWMGSSFVKWISISTSNKGEGHSSLKSVLNYQLEQMWPVRISFKVQWAFCAMNFTVRLFSRACRDACRCISVCYRRFDVFVKLN